MRLINHASNLVHQICQREKVEDVVKRRDGVAPQLQICKRTLAKLVSEKRIPAVRIG